MNIQSSRKLPGTKGWVVLLTAAGYFWTRSIQMLSPAPMSRGRRTGDSVAEIKEI